MGMDLIALVKHNKTADEILDSPNLINTALDFKTRFKDKFPNSNLIKAKWNGPHLMTNENLEKIWETEEKEKDKFEELKDMNYYAEMDIPYAELTFHRQTIEISPHSLHKYGNFRTPEWASFILQMNREIAKLFQSDKIVYYVDSYEPQSLLLDYSLKGETIENIIKLGNEKFGKPPKTKPTYNM